MFTLVTEVISVLFLAVVYALGIYIAFFIIFSIFKKDNLFSIRSFSVYILIVSYLLGLGYLTMKEYWGSDTIGSFFSKYEYSAKYYVYLFPEGSKSKNYKVPAEFHVNGKAASIYQIKWPNGGYTVFDSDELEELYNRESIHLYDSDDRYWTVVLTDEKVK